MTIPNALRRLEFDGEIIPRGLVTVGTGANDQYGFNYEFRSGSTPLNVSFAITPTAGVGRQRKFGDRHKSCEVSLVCSSK